LNSRQAKRLRSIVYDEIPEETTYRNIIRKVNGKYVNTGAKRCSGKREIYLNMKKKYKEKKYNGC
jgi:hypothetical protein